jgi:hypothetical protein
LIRVVIFDPCRHTLFVSSYLTCVIILFCANLVNLSPCEAEKVYPNTNHCIVVWSSSVLFLCMQYCLILYIKKNVLRQHRSNMTTRIKYDNTDQIWQHGSNMTTRIKYDNTDQVWQHGSSMTTRIKYDDTGHVLLHKSSMTR